MKTDTPRTDAILNPHREYGEVPASLIDHARELERENAKLRAEGNRLADMLELAPCAPVDQWPTDAEIMAEIKKWRAI